MNIRARFLDVLDKAENGPVVRQDEFDKKYVQEPISELIEKYDVKWNKDLLVPYDDELADRVFFAGLELAQETGVYCLDSRRQMIWSKDELDEVIATTPKQITLGVRSDSVTIKARRPEENSRIPVVGGAFGIPMREDLFVPVMLSYAQEPLIDIVSNASLLSTYGRPIRAGSPWEAVGCWQEADLSFEAIRRVGRTGIPISCAEDSPSVIGELSTTTYGGFRPTDSHHASFISELKTSYAELTKAYHFARTGSFVHTFYNPIYGGYPGGKEGLAIVMVAGLILMKACYASTTLNPGPSHAFLSCDTHPEMISALSVAFQGLSRNTDLLTSSFVRPVGGPGTKDILYESAAVTIASVPSGVAQMEGVQSAMGNNPNHCSGLEARFTAQVTHASEELSRKEANSIVKRLVEKYVDALNDKNVGKPFNEVYDIDTIKPTEEWQQIYNEVCKEIEEEFGLSL